MVGGVAATAAVRTFPFRVFSFPSEIKTTTIAEYADFVTYSDLTTSAAIDPVVEQAAQALAFRVGQTVDVWRWAA